MIDITSGHPQPGNVIGAAAAGEVGDPGPGEWKPEAPGDVLPGLLLLERRGLHHRHHQHVRSGERCLSHEALRFCAEWRGSSGVDFVDL